MLSNPQDYETIIIDTNFHNSNLPTLVKPVNSSNWQDCIHDIKQIVKQQLHQTGGFLFRGFDVNGPKDFNSFT